MKILSKLIPFSGLMLLISACEKDKFFSNITNTDGKFWIKVALTMALLLAFQFIMRKLRK